MDLDKIIELTKSKYLVEDALPYSHKKVIELMNDGYFLSTVNYDIDNNYVDIIFMSLEGPITCIVLIAELKENC